MILIKMTVMEMISELLSDCGMLLAMICVWETYNVDVVNEKNALYHFANAVT
jgi:hypothetical protein